MKPTLYLFCFLLTACSVARKVVPEAPPELYTDAFEVPVTVKDGWLTAKTVSLGTYATSSRTNGVAANTPAKQLKNVSDAFYFTVKELGQTVQSLGTLRITFSNRPLPAYLSSLAGDMPLWYMHVGAAAADPLKTWEVILKKNISFTELNENKSVGVLRSATEEIRITAHNRFGIRNSHEQTCYEFQLKGVPLAAVIPGATPKAWINSNTEEPLRQTLAAVMLALVFR